MAIGTTKRVLLEQLRNSFLFRKIISKFEDVEVHTQTQLRDKSKSD
jgi:hypothetical protein